MFSQFHSSWVLQLLEEHRQICYTYNVRLKRPLIQVTPSSSFWGRWQSEFQKIEISEKLILDYDWLTVLQVLKHEMAHQYVSEILKSRDGHGKDFKKACQVLGVPPEFQTSSGELPETLSPYPGRHKVTTTNKSLMEKAKKLLSLAQSDNEHEATLAMKKVQEIYFKYNLTHIEENDFEFKIIYFYKKRLPATTSSITAILSEFYFVKCIFSSIYEAKKKESYQTLELIGRSENVKMAEYVFHFLQTKIENIWNNYKKSNNAPGTLKRSYQLGLLKGLYQKLEDQKMNMIDFCQKHNIMQNHTQSPSTLMPIQNQLVSQEKALKKYLKSLHPKISHSRSSKSAIYSHIYSQGQRDGRQIVISKGIQSQVKNKGLKLKSFMNFL